LQPIPKPKRTPKSKRPINPQKHSRIVDPLALKRAARDYCVFCQRTDQPLQIHHIVFKSQGGSDVDDNLICICLPCHNRAHGLVKDEFISKEALYYAKEGDNASHRE
jgi:5-methylcytosine-specific restriction endonuclease McrA